MSDGNEKLAAVLREQVQRGAAAARALDVLENSRERLKARIAEAEATGKKDLALVLKARLVTARPEADVLTDLGRGPLDEHGRPA